MVERPVNILSQDPGANLLMSQYLTQPTRRSCKWGDASLLESLKNPSDEPYEIQVHCPEVTFIGKKEQPDFACVDITLVPGDRVIELKSLKQYLFSFRESLMSYERFVNVLYHDLMEVYRPKRLVVQAQLRARGGISSKLKIDSLWRTQPDEPDSLAARSLARAS
jgi:7-cyano-7-deazaguanine reductase